MAEQAPKQTPPQTPPNGEKSDLDPTVTLKFEPHINPEERSALLRQRLGADATLRGNEDMQGLDLTVTDDDGDSTRFVVTHSSERQVDKPVEELKRFSRPRIQGPLFSRPSEEHIAERAREGRAPRLIQFNGRHAFSRLKVESPRKNYGMPRLARRGGSLDVVRKSTAANPSYERFVTYDVYDKSGDLVDTRTEPVDTFYEDAGEALTGVGDDQAPQAKWDWKGRERSEKAANPDDTLEIGLTRGKKHVAQDITEQLENHGITNWGGLMWQLEVPGAGPLPASHAHRTGHDSHKTNIGLRTRTQEIISDRTVKELNEQGTGYDYTRRFTVRTTERYEDGSTTVLGEDTFENHELWHYLDKPNDFPDVTKSPDVKGYVIWNMRMPDARSKTRDSLAYGVAEKWHHASNNPDTSNDPHLTVDDMLGVLSAPELYPDTEEGRAALHADIERLRGTEHEAYAQELLEIINAAGVTAFDEAIGTIKKAYEKDLERIGIEPSHADESPGWIIEALVEQSKAYRDHGNPHPLESALLSRDFVRNMIDERIGMFFGLAAVKVMRVEVPDGTDDDGKPKTKEKVVHDFNDSLFKKLSIPNAGPGSYGALKKDKEWRDKIWKPIKSQTHKVYEQIIKGNEIDEADARLLGRMLRRTVGE